MEVIEVKLRLKTIHWWIFASITWYRIISKSVCLLGPFSDRGINVFWSLNVIQHLQKFSFNELGISIWQSKTLSPSIYMRKDVSRNPYTSRHFFFHCCIAIRFSVQPNRLGQFIVIYIWEGSFLESKMSVKLASTWGGNSKLTDSSAKVYYWGGGLQNS
jgi:hypothetical protein